MTNILDEWFTEPLADIARYFILVSVMAVGIVFMLLPIIELVVLLVVIPISAPQYQVAAAIQQVFSPAVVYAALLASGSIVLWLNLYQSEKTDDKKPIPT